MLNGIAPIIIFTFKKTLTDISADLVESALDAISPIPELEDRSNKKTFPVAIIPIYLDEKITGICIDAESKNIDVDTEIISLPNGSEPIVVQKGLNSSITINMTASANSIGLSILLAFSDLILSKLLSEEYSITYIHKAVTVFDGRINSFAVTQNDNNDLYKLTLVLAKGGKSTSQAKNTPTALSPGATGIDGLPGG